ncbi:LacI family transcriptional regulator [Herbiconiux sp. CPCC 203407]|uniref:LacI family transcriptional regulator n=1 Tax=Herbiconiux oxytropis TaxID=2970915 RepID=A0AA41XDV2_9MICO|nr:LacI family DNA-binding transcriptional regulator [Herbiconiux oxytropis]MCS5721011.1 LacI family transcriptional regulator [Herbiconiux oxytropis]MCS5724663.1 LacI family transcriptional regulator [Herbiconiux oxytropis]
MATIKDVARHAGVSAGTVSNVLNRPGYVAAVTRERVLASIADLGFTPTQEARKFRTGRGRTLGLAVADLANPFFVDVALGAEAEAKELGVGVVVIHNGEDATREQHNLDVLVQQRVHGIMIAPVHEEQAQADRLDGRGIPLVYVDRVSDGSEGCWVRTDDLAGGGLAGRHLLGLGHRRVAFVGSFGGTTQADHRFEGFATALAAVGSRPERLATLSWRIDDGREAGAALAARPRDDLPTAVMCINDLIAMGLLIAFAEHGIRVPDDVSVVGFDDLTWAATAMVPLTTVRQPRAELGRRAVRMLLDEIDRGETHVHRHELLEPELVVRSSSGAPRDDLAVSAHDVAPGGSR